jgi:hypothetical protein
MKLRFCLSVLCATLILGCGAAMGAVIAPAQDSNGPSISPFPPPSPWDDNLAISPFPPPSPWDDNLAISPFPPPSPWDDNRA